MNIQARCADAVGYDDDRRVYQYAQCATYHSSTCYLFMMSGVLIRHGWAMSEATLEEWLRDMRRVAKRLRGWPPSGYEALQRQMHYRQWRRNVRRVA